ncbi:cell division protein SepF [Eubacterium sp. MSJ-33]|uniref:cell division protein SepF n=1 Tax=Eubacterium sp. MSJ-33 TaxID=2841528 RepID=UPI001C761D98|nr:cell division protein SepF [Eubacterium sp. MSJ-33]QWT53567.1 cell division protein SepF [Eubacterium sp. MSJ-33]
MAKDAGKKSFLDFFKVKNIDDDDDEFDDDLFDEDDYDDDDDDYDDVQPSRVKSKSSFGKTTARSAASSKYEAATQQPTASHKSQAVSSSSGKLVDFKDSQRQSYSRSSDFRSRSEVFVIKPQETDEAQSVIDFLRANKTIVINIEGLDVSVAQRIIDYVGGACYAMGGSLNVVSSNIFIATPQDIEVSGDLREELVSQDALTPYVQY